MSTGTKAKAWRGIQFITPCGSTVEREVADPLIVHGKCDCLVIPDGATIPLPADVRRVLMAAEKWMRYYTGKPATAPVENDMASAILARRRAEKRRKAGGL